MSSYSSSREQLVDSLTRYTKFLQSRNAALDEIRRASDDLRNGLSSESDSDVAALLDARDVQCRRMVEISSRQPDHEDVILDAARKAADGSGGDVADLARLALALHSDSRTLAQRVLSCQVDCETILKARLDATAQALKQSRQRRKLDAAYGQATTHYSPVYLDKQQ